MFLSLRPRAGDKTISIYVSDLAHDENFRPESSHEWEFEVRSQANRAIQKANEELGQGRRKAFQLINQFRWSGETGWEYWDDDIAKILPHALRVSELLHLPLHRHIGLMEEVLQAAARAKLEIDFAIAKPIESPNAKDTKFLNRELVAEKYFVLIR